MWPARIGQPQQGETMTSKSRKPGESRAHGRSVHLALAVLLLGFGFGAGWIVRDLNPPAGREVTQSTSAAQKTAADQKPKQEALAPLRTEAELLAELLPDPRIVNTHEHLMGGENPLAKLDEANERTGVVTSVLVASSRYTFTLKKGTGFVEHHKNNEYLCGLARRDPSRYHAWVTFDPLEDNKVEKLKDYLRKGATGVKLYAGHGAKTGDDRPFHVCRLDDDHLLPLYDFCERYRIPICLHINMRKFEAEARSIFTRFPNLPMIVPHYGLWSGKLDDLDKLLDNFPNLMTDNSFGWWYTTPAFKRYEKNNHKFREFMIKHQERMLFGTDVVVTTASSKSADALTEFWLSYRASLELSEFDFRDKDGVLHRFKGLALPEWVVRKIYHENWDRMIAQLDLPPELRPTTAGTN